MIELRLDNDEARVLCIAMRQFYEQSTRRPASADSPVIERLHLILDANVSRERRAMNGRETPP